MFVGYLIIIIIIISNHYEININEPLVNYKSVSFERDIQAEKMK